MIRRERLRRWFWFYSMLFSSGLILIFSYLAFWDKYILEGYFILLFILTLVSVFVFLLCCKKLSRKLDNIVEGR